MKGKRQNVTCKDVQAWDGLVRALGPMQAGRVHRIVKREWHTLQDIRRRYTPPRQQQVSISRGAPSPSQAPQPEQQAAAQI